MFGKVLIISRSTELEGSLSKTTWKTGKLKASVKDHHYFNRGHSIITLTKNVPNSDNPPSLFTLLQHYCHLLPLKHSKLNLTTPTPPTTSTNTNVLTITHKNSTFCDSAVL